MTSGVQPRSRFRPQAGRAGTRTGKGRGPGAERGGRGAGPSAWPQRGRDTRGAPRGVSSSTFLYRPYHPLYLASVLRVEECLHPGFWTPGVHRSAKGLAALQNSKGVVNANCSSFTNATSWCSRIPLFWGEWLEKKLERTVSKPKDQ